MVGSVRVGDGVRALRRAIKGRARLLAVGSAAVGSAVVATVVRRRRHVRLDLPEAGALAAETARSVHNAAKATLISAVRSAENPDEDLVARTVQDAVHEAARAGTDVTSVAVGVVEGAASVAHLLGVGGRHLAAVAARSAVDAAGAHGEIAAQRVQGLFTPHVLP